MVLSAVGNGWPAGTVNRQKTRYTRLHGFKFGASLVTAHARLQDKSVLPDCEPTADSLRSSAEVQSSGGILRSSRPLAAEAWALPGKVRRLHGYELAIQWRFRR